MGKPWAERHGAGWRCRWRDSTGRVVVLSSGWPSDAKALEKGYERLLQLGETGHVGQGELPFQTYVDTIWMPRRQRLLRQGRLAESTVANETSHLAAHLGPRFGPLPLGEITLKGYDAWIDELRDAGVPESSIRTYATLMSTIMRDAVGDHVLDEFPFERPRQDRRRRGRDPGSRRRPPGAQKRAVITPLQMLIAAERCGAITGREEDFVATVLRGWAGLRAGEIVGLEVPFVHETHIDVEWQLAEVGGQFHHREPKLGSSRQVDINPGLSWLLQRLLARNPKPCDCHGMRVLFTAAESAHWRRSNYDRRVWYPAIAGRYPEQNGQHPRPARHPVIDGRTGGVLSLRWEFATPGEPWAPSWRTGRNKAPRDAHFAAWVPLSAELTKHGCRRVHRTWLDEDLVELPLKQERMGHLPGGRTAPAGVSAMDAVYSDTTTVMRDKAVAAMERRWQAALRQRARMPLPGAVPLLEELLAPLRKELRDSGVRLLEAS